MPDAVAAEGEAEEGRGVSVLCVDDEPEVVDLTATYLERAGFETSTATSAAAGLEELREHRPDCVVSDYQMPEMNGLEFLDAVRERYPDLPFILFTGRGSEEVASDAISRGVTDYLQKRADTEQYEVLANRIRNAVDRYRAEARFDTFVESAADGIAIVGRDGTIQRVNERLEAQFGYDREELVGEPVELLVPERHRERHERQRERYVESPEPRPMGADLDLTGRRKDGSEFPVDISLSPIEIGGRQEVMASVRIRSERVEETDTGEGLAGMRGTETLPVGVLVRDASGVVAHANERAVDLLGVEREELVGTVPDPAEWDPRDELELPVEGRSLPFERVLETGEPVEAEQLSVATPDGQRRWLRVNAAPLERGSDPTHVTYTLEDVTEFKRREAEREDRLDRITDGFLSVDESWEITYANRQAARFLGREREELIDADLSETFPDAVETDFHDAAHRALTSQEPTVVEEWYGPLDALFEARLYPSETGLSIYFRDVTARRERREELERYETIVETIKDGVFTLDPDGVVTFANEAFVETTRVDSAEELVGRHISMLLEERTLEEGRDRVQALLEEEIEAASFEIETTDPEGETSVYDVRMSLLPSQDGEFTGTVGVVRDVTDAKERERELELYERIVDATPDAIYALDRELRFTVVDDMLLSAIDRPEEAVLGEPLSLLAEEGIASRETIGEAEAVLEELLAGERENGRLETTIIVGGTELVVENHFSRLESDGELYGIVNTVRDITERHDREMELARQNERLEEFASIVSHDLRNPLNVAEGYLDLARESGDEADFERVVRAHGRMAELIDDLLTLARNGQRVEETEPVDLQAICEEAWSTVESGAATLSVLADDRLPADRERLRSLFENLFANAVQHGGDRVTVEVGSLDGGGFYVADDGPGIPEEKRAGVFERGFSTAEAGTGFGLAIVESVVEAHGWSVDVTESDAGGARFEIETGARPRDADD